MIQRREGLGRRRAGGAAAMAACLGLLLSMIGCVGGPAASSPASTAPSMPIASGRVDIGGRSLEVSCQGSGGPLVMLEAGLGNTLDVWTPVMDRIDDVATVCAYDRAGLGGSDPRPPPHGAAAAADDLAALLEAMHAPTRVILVGASYGGIVTQLFARRFPEKIEGVVLVDALAAGWDDRLEALLTPEQVAARRAIPNGEDVTNEEIRESERALSNAPPFPAVPLVVLRHGLPFPGPPGWPTEAVEALWASLQQDLAALSPTSAQLVANESGHRIHQDQPDLVAAAIRAIVDPSRWPPSATDRTTFGAGAPAVAPGTISGTFVFSAADGLVAADGAGKRTRTLLAGGGRIVGEPSIDHRGDRLAYTSIAKPAPGGGPQGDSDSEVWILDLGTGKARRVGTGRVPALSPDGSKVVFSREGRSYLVDISTSGPSEEVDLGEGGCAVWSPDGTQLAMCSNDGGTFLLTIATMAHTALSTGSPSEPTAWSPDGSSIAIASASSGDDELYVLDVATGAQRRLSDAPGSQAGGPWTPDGLFVTSSAPGADVSDWFLVDPATATIRVVPWMRGLPNPIAWYR